LSNLYLEYTEEMKTKEQMREEFYHKLNAMQAWEEKEWSKVFDYFWQQMEEQRKSHLRQLRKARKSLECPAGFLCDWDMCCSEGQNLIDDTKLVLDKYISNLSTGEDE
jgi:predicted N-acyltransferase